MGTNFYLHEPSEHAEEVAIVADWCHAQGYLAAEAVLRSATIKEGELHIGKSSAGWCFSLHVIPDEGLNSLDDWKERWSRPGAIIKDEYGDVVTPEEMLSRITERRYVGKGGRTESQLAANYATRGPNGLVRHTYNCVGHGEGTWDLISGEFS